MPSIMYVLVHAHIFQWGSSQLCLFLFLLFSTPLKTFPTFNEAKDHGADAAQNSKADAFQTQLICHLCKLHQC